MHDVPATGSRQEDESRGLVTKEALTRLLVDEIERRGLQPVSLDRLLRAGPPVKRVRLR